MRNIEKGILFSSLRRVSVNLREGQQSSNSRMWSVIVKFQKLGTREEDSVSASCVCECLLGVCVCVYTHARVCSWVMGMKGNKKASVNKAQENFTEHFCDFICFVLFCFCCCWFVKMMRKPWGS